MYKFLGLAVVLAGIFSVSYGAQRVADSSLEVNNAWVRATTKSQKTSAAYFTLSNNGSVDRTLVSANSFAADAVELHTSTMQPNGLMVMGEVPFVSVPAGDMVAFEAGGYHVMLIGLKEQLVIGRDIPLTLKFKNGDVRTVRAKVKSTHTKKSMKNMNMDMQHHKH